MTICTPLTVERAALLGVTDGVPVRRSGAGTRKTRARAAGTPSGPVLVAGVAGAVTAGLEPGDVVVATEVRGVAGTVPSPSAPMLAAAIRRQGVTVHTGPIASADKIVHGAARAGFAASGVLAVDLESAALAELSHGDSFAAIRAIVDTPEHALLRPGTAHRGITALRALRSSAPAMREWVDALAAREVVLASPRSFCAGVGRAIEIVERSLAQHDKPVYVRRQIVHNAHVVRDLEQQGAVFVQELDEVPSGSLVVLAAHGVSPDVRAQAVDRELSVIDATCPLVTKVHNEVRRYSMRGDTVFLIGHAEHEEVVGTVGEAPQDVIVVADAAEARRVQVRDPERVAYVMQTTLAVDEAAEVADVLRSRFPALSAPRRDDICYATTNRQLAVRSIAEDTELVLVVGSKNSSNSVRLVEVAERHGTPAYLVDDVTEVDLRWLKGVTSIGVTAGASAPPHLVDDLVHCLSGLGPVTTRTARVVEENVEFTLPREVS